MSLIKCIIQSLSTLLLIVHFPLTSSAVDPAIGRAELMAQMSQKDIDQQSLRFKIIRSRALILYLQDILPNKGNPYFHMAEFSSKATLTSFNNAQNTISSLMNDTVNPAWLPLSHGGPIRAEDMADPQVAPVIRYFSQYVAIADIMSKTIQPVLKHSIIIGSVKQTAGAEVEEKYLQALTFIEYFANTYRKLLKASPAGKKELELQKKRTLLMVSASIASGMREYIHYVSSSDNSNSLEGFISQIETLPYAELDKVKSQVKVITSPSAQGYQKIRRALESVDLPDTGDIDGADQAFEIAIRLEVGFDILQKLFEQIRETW